jgi:hypothetical protein
MNGAGTYVPHVLIFLRKNMKPELMEGEPPVAISSCLPSGRIKQHFFTERFQHFLSFAKPANEDQAVLAFDVHYSHSRNMDVIDIAR